MLLNFKVNNYMNISKEITLNCNKDIIYIYGRDNSGKTSIINSIIFAISHVISPVQYILHEKIDFYKRFIPNFNFSKGKCKIGLRLKLNSGITFIYELELAKDNLENIYVYSESLKENQKLLFEREKNILKGSEILKEYKIEKYVDNSIPLISNLIISGQNKELNALYEYLKKTVVIDNSLNSSLMTEKNIELLQKEKSMVIKILKRVDSRYKDFIVKDKNIINIYKDEMKTEFETESSTIRSLLLYIPPIIDAIKCGNLILIDDVDKKIPISVFNIIKRLLTDKSINKNNAQLITSVCNKEYIDEGENNIWLI